VLDGVLAALAAYEPEVLTVLTSLNGTAVGQEDITAAVARLLPDAEVAIYAGGQPLYPILVGAE
jgi:dihydroxyacetone kinase-like predicted kinase